MHSPANTHPLTSFTFTHTNPYIPFKFQTPSPLHRKYKYKAVLEPRVSPAFAITFFCIHCNILDLKIHQSMWIHWRFFPKTWTKGHWALDDLWPHVCWGHMCDSTQGSLRPSPMTIHQCMWIQWSILQNTTYIHIHTYTYIHIHTTYRMSDHIVSYWTQFRRYKNHIKIAEHIDREICMQGSQS